VMSRLRARDAADDADHADQGVKRRPRQSKARLAQPMVVCAHCGVHLPQADAVADGAGRLFCGDEHRIAGPR
jgi:hypothetical protein